MKVKDIPQDNISTYDGHRKIIYGTQNGHYEAATSTGWADEAYVTGQAVAELDEKAEAAKQAFLKGECSVLYYYMYRYRYDEISLAQSTGFWRWQIRRHFRPEIFAKLSDAALAKYAQAFQVGADVLKNAFDGLRTECLSESKAPGRKDGSA